MRTRWGTGAAHHDYPGSQVSSRCSPDASTHRQSHRRSSPGPRRKFASGSAAGVWAAIPGGRRASDGLAPCPGPPRDRVGGGGTLPFIYKLLEVLGEDTTGQLGRRLWETAKGWGSDAQGRLENHREKVLPGPEPMRTAQHFLGALRRQLSWPQSLHLARGGTPHPSPSGSFPAGPVTCLANLVRVFGVLWKALVSGS